MDLNNQQLDDMSVTDRQCDLQGRLNRIIEEQLRHQEELRKGQAETNARLDSLKEELIKGQAATAAQFATMSGQLTALTIAVNAGRDEQARFCEQTFVK
ncbi:hypothetical protein KEM56_005878 [Ascosphaera pollenicola]|nr:hypothetical protein KEM56_005878 [Ascosphaera pollenicola]